MTRPAIVLLLCTLIVGACAGPAATSSPTPSPSPTETPEGLPTEPVEEPCEPPDVCPGPLAPGEYSSNSFGPTIGFTVSDAEWVAGEDLEDAGFWLERTDVGGINVVTVTHFEGEVFAEACSTPQETTTEEIERSASALVAFLAEREGIDATEPAHVNVGGHHAVQIDLTTALPAACTDPAWIWLWVIQAVGDFHFNDAEQARVIALDVGETTVVIVAEAFPDADYDAFLTASTELIESMTIEP